MSVIEILSHYKIHQKLNLFIIFVKMQIKNLKLQTKWKKKTSRYNF